MFIFFVWVCLLFSVHHFCCYMSRRTNSAGSMVWIHCWKCKVMIVIMIMIAIIITIIRPISCDVMMIKHLEILHYLSASLLKWTDCISCSAADIYHWIYIYIYICVCVCVSVSVFISIFIFCYGTEKCHIHIVWYVAQSCELVITTSKISASRLKRCHGHEELYTMILFGWTLWQ